MRCRGTGKRRQTLAVVCLVHLRTLISSTTYEGPLPRLVYLLREPSGRLRSIQNNILFLTLSIACSPWRTAGWRRPDSRTLPSHGLLDSGFLGNRSLAQSPVPAGAHSLHRAREHCGWRPVAHPGTPLGHHSAFPDFPHLPGQGMSHPPVGHGLAQP